MPRVARAARYECLPPQLLRTVYCGPDGRDEGASGLERAARLLPVCIRLFQRGLQGRSELRLLGCVLRQVQ
jgi:hypothetical protein